MYKDVRNYGFVARADDPSMDRTVYANEVQGLSGFPLGIITPSAWFPQLPGNVGNGWTYPFPVRHIRVDVSVQQLFDADGGAVTALKEAAQNLVEEGCRAISGNCGYFANYQKELQDCVDVPVAMSSLLQINWLKPMIGSRQKVGVICASREAFTEEMLRKVGVEDPSIVAVAGLQDTEEFGPLVAMTEGVHCYNPKRLGEEVSAKAVALAEENDLGAILLECSDLPPFAHMVAAATNLPVFDFVSLHKWLYNGVCRQPFPGFM